MKNKFRGLFKILQMQWKNCTFPTKTSHVTWTMVREVSALVQNKCNKSNIHKFPHFLRACFLRLRKNPSEFVRKRLRKTFQIFPELKFRASCFWTALRREHDEHGNHGAAVDCARVKLFRVHHYQSNSFTHIDPLVTGVIERRSFLGLSCWLITCNNKKAI